MNEFEAAGSGWRFKDNTFGRKKRGEHHSRKKREKEGDQRKKKKWRGGRWGLASFIAGGGGERSVPGSRVHTCDKGGKS